MAFDFTSKLKVQKSKPSNMFNTETMLPISEIKNDTMILKDGWLRAILKVSGLNMDLKNFEEQQIILEQYKKFLNGMDFPIQIIVRNTYLDLSDYLNYVKKNVAVIENTTLQKQGDAYFEFLQNIDMQQGLIFTKEFYIVVPYYEAEDDNKQVKKSRWEKFLNVLQAKDSVEKIVSRYRSFLKGKRALETRCGLIADGLGSMSIDVERVGTSDIISLLFRCYNPLIHSSESKMV